MSFTVSSIAYGAVDGSADVTTSNFSLSAYDLLLIYFAGNTPQSSATINKVSGENLAVPLYASITNTTNNIRIYVFRGMVYAAGTYNITLLKSDGLSFQPYVYHIIRVSGGNSGGTNGSGATYGYSTGQSSGVTTLSVTTSLPPSPGLNISAFAHLANEDITISGFTNLSSASRSSPNVSMRIGYLQDTSTAVATWTTPGKTVAIGVGINTEQTRPPQKFIVL